MGKSRYLSNLKKELSGVEKSRKDEILKEVESYIEQSDISFESLVEKFGEPKELAHNYLEDLPQEKLNKKKSFSNTKKVLLGLLGIFVAFILIVFYTISSYLKDDFDYSKYSVTSVDKKVEGAWLSMVDKKIIDIKQSVAVIYWGAKEGEISYNCKGNISEDGERLNIKQAVCYLKVPNKAKIDINSNQSKIVFVKPNSKLNLQVEQSSIKIAENKQAYEYNLQLEKSIISGLKSVKGGVVISGKLIESELEKYEY